MKCISRKLLPRLETATQETIAVEFEESENIINVTIKISDNLLRRYPSVSRGNIPESVLDDLIKSVLMGADTIKDGHVLTISAPQTNPHDPSVNCMISCSSSASNEYVSGETEL